MCVNGLVDVAVIGAGASGALVAVQFARHARQDARLALIGAGERPARGVAYATRFRSNLLNVRAGNMSAFADAPQDFICWLNRHYPEMDGMTFAPRQVYGDYLAGVLAEALQSGLVLPVDSEAIGLERALDAQSWNITLQDGGIVQARSVVLAVGNVLAPADPLDMSEIEQFYRRNPWDADIITGLDSDAPVLLVGTGLTMADVVLSLRESGHTGVIHAVSRHGRLSQRHSIFQPRPLESLPAEFASPVRALRWIRQEVKKAQHVGDDWRAVVDGLRPHTAVIWQGWSNAQRASFLRHGRNLWDVHRHRMAPEIGNQLDQLVLQDVLKIHAARLIRAQSDGLLANVTVQSAHSNQVLTLQVARVINCTGPGRDFSRVNHPLIRQMRQAGWLHPDPLRLGILTGANGGLTGVDGRAIPGLYTLGPLRIPALWESVAMPEIRMQAKELGSLLAMQKNEGVL